MRRLRTGLLALPFLLLLGCPNQTTADPDAGIRPDGGPPPEQGVVLEQANLAPAAQTAENENIQIRGRLKSTGGQKASTSTKEIRGGFVPLTR